MNVAAADDDRWTRNRRYYGWTQRLIRPLGVGNIEGDELWADPSTRPDFPQWQALAERRDKDADPDSLGYHMTRTLIPELLFAGGGVETEFLRLRDALDAAQEWTDDIRRQLPVPDDIRSTPNAGLHTSVPPLLDAYYAFWNLLAWTRAVEERVYRVFQKAKRGLLPALKPGAPVQTQVKKALAAFHDRTRDTRLFANYVLHAGAIPGGGSPRADVTANGRIRVRLPDPPLGPITTWEEFDFDEGRDMLTYAEEVMEAVDQFITKVLSAFEDNIPERFR